MSTKYAFFCMLKKTGLFLGLSFKWSCMSNSPLLVKVKNCRFNMFDKHSLIDLKQNCTLVFYVCEEWYARIIIMCHKETSIKKCFYFEET